MPHQRRHSPLQPGLADRAVHEHGHKRSRQDTDRHHRDTRQCKVDDGARVVERAKGNKPDGVPRQHRTIGSEMPQQAGHEGEYAQPDADTKQKQDRLLRKRRHQRHRGDRPEEGAENPPYAL